MPSGCPIWGLGVRFGGWSGSVGGRDIPENSQQALDRFDELKKPAIIKVGETVVNVK